MAMLQIIQLGAHQLYAAGLTLILAWLITMARPVAQYVVDLWLPDRAPTWVNWGTLLLQALLLFSGVFFILRWLGMGTILAVAVVLLLYLIAKNMYRSELIRTRVATLRTHTLRRVRPGTVVVTVPPQHDNASGSDDGVPQPTVLLIASGTAEAVEVTTNAEGVIVAETTPESTVEILTPLTGNISQPSKVVVRPPRLRSPVTLTRRPSLGKKTTAGLW